MTAYGLLTQNRPLFAQAMGEVNRGQATDATGRKLALPDTLPGLQAARLAEREEARRKNQMMTEQGTAENLADALIDERVTAMRDAGVSEMEIQTWLLQTRFQRFLRGNDSFLRSGTAQRRVGTEPVDSELMEQVGEALDSPGASGAGGTSGGGTTIIDRRVNIGQQINNAVNPYTGDLGRRDPE